MDCRFCQTPLQHQFVSLGVSPLSNAFLTRDQLSRMEPFYPLEAWVCHRCFLVQIDQFEKPQSIFSDYAYFSSYSDTWLEHSRAYVDQVIRDYQIGQDSFVVEIASNDGYLLQNFIPYKIPVLGVEPAQNVAQEANRKGIPTTIFFFGRKTAERMIDTHGRADLLIANNVL